MYRYVGRDVRAGDRVRNIEQKKLSDAWNINMNELHYVIWHSVVLFTIFKFSIAWIYAVPDRLNRKTNQQIIIKHLCEFLYWYWISTCMYAIYSAYVFKKEILFFLVQFEFWRFMTNISIFFDEIIFRYTKYCGKTSLHSNQLTIFVSSIGYGFIYVCLHGRLIVSYQKSNINFCHHHHHRASWS